MTKLTEVENKLFRLNLGQHPNKHGIVIFDHKNTHKVLQCPKMAFTVRNELQLITVIDWIILG